MNGLKEALNKLEIYWTRYEPGDVLTEYSRDTTLLIACSDYSDHALFRYINEIAIDADISSLFVNIDAHIAKCGPVVIPRANACYECYFHRLNSTRIHIEEFQAASQTSHIVCQPTPNFLTLHWAISAALTKILALISGLDLDLHLAPMQEINVFNGELVNSKLLKIPRCPVCGTANGDRPFSTVINTKLALKARK